MALHNVCMCVGVRRFVIGSVGPTNRTLSLSPSVENPEYRNVSKSSLIVYCKMKLSCSRTLPGGCESTVEPSKQWESQFASSLEASEPYRKKHWSLSTVWKCSLVRVLHCRQTETLVIMYLFVTTTHCASSIACSQRLMSWWVRMESRWRGWWKEAWTSSW